jgi:hypothetical protein
MIVTIEPRRRRKVSAGSGSGSGSQWTGKVRKTKTLTVEWLRGNAKRRSKDPVEEFVKENTPHPELLGRVRLYSPENALVVSTPLSYWCKPQTASRVFSPVQYTCSFCSSPITSGSTTVVSFNPLLPFPYTFGCDACGAP